jgi:hypothetical protein
VELPLRFLTFQSVLVFFGASFFILLFVDIQPYYKILLLLDQAGMYMRMQIIHELIFQQDISEPEGFKSLFSDFFKTSLTRP